MKISEITALKAVVKYVLIYRQKNKEGVFRKHTRKFDSEAKAKNIKEKLERKGVTNIKLVAPVQFLIGFDEATGSDHSASATIPLEDYPPTTKIID